MAGRDVRFYVYGGITDHVVRCCTSGEPNAFSQSMPERYCSICHVRLRKFMLTAWSRGILRSTQVCTVQSPTVIILTSFGFREVVRWEVL
jgi:hypothetical protein